MDLETTCTGLARYGLQTNPYEKGPLDPLRTDLELSKAVGVARELEQVEDYVERAAKAGETAFVLVQGKSGTGRTSVCNHLLRYHCNVRGIKPERFVLPKTKFDGQDAFAIFRRWLVSLYGGLKKAKLTPLGKEDGFNLDEELAEAALDQEMFATEATPLMAQLASVLKAKSAGFGVCFENVKDFSLIRAAFEAFDEAGTLVLATVLDYPRTKDGITFSFESHPSRGRAVGAMHYPILNLETIQGEAAKDLVQFHWMAAVDGVLSPFEDHGLVEVFGDKARPAGRVLSVTSKVLSSHADSVGPGSAWPEDRETLFLERERLRVLVPAIDKALPEPFVDE